MCVLTVRTIVGIGVGFAVVAIALGFSVSATSAQQVPGSRSQITLSFAPVVKAVAPAVVNIYTKRVVQSRRIPSVFDDPFFRRFFGDAMPNFRRPPREQNSLGSGVIVRSDGLVVTNAHVIDKADEIRVVLSDKREFDATLVTLDKQTDLALLRIDAAGQGLPTLSFGDPDRLEVGDLVLAIGNPFGVGQTVTSGIVSALARTNVGISDFGFFIQTDAAINPGNSGGALVGMDGRLLGVNTAIFSKSGGSIGIGFAIPVNMVRAVVASADRGGRIVRPWIGAATQPVTNDIAQSIGLARPAGVMINDLYPGGPADRAGIQVGDVVMAIGGYPIEDEGGLKFRLATLEVNSTETITVLRGDRRLNLNLGLIAPPENPQRDERTIEGSNPFGGSVVANISPALAAEISLDEPTAQGVVVMRVRRRGPAARVGIRPGDIVLSIDGQSIRDTRALVREMERTRSRWSVKIRRNGEVETINVRS